MSDVKSDPPKEKKKEEQKVLGIGLSDVSKQGLGFLSGILLTAIAAWWINNSKPQLFFHAPDYVEFFGDQH